MSTISMEMDVAKIVGANAAIIFQGVAWWVVRNKSNESNYHDGRYWTYSSNAGLQKTYYFLTKRQIEVSIEKLKEAGLILVDNFNEDKRNRTLWYTLTDYGELMYGHNTGKKEAKDSINHISQNCNSHITERGNESSTDENCNNIYNNNIYNTVNNTVNNTDIREEYKEEPSFASAMLSATETWNELSAYGIAPISRIASGTKRYKELKARVNEYGIEDVIRAIGNVKRSRFLTGQNDKHWKITFDWFVCPNNFIKVLDGNYKDSDYDVVPLMPVEKPVRRNSFGDIIER